MSVPPFHRLDPENILGFGELSSEIGNFVYAFGKQHDLNFECEMGWRQDALGYFVCVVHRDSEHSEMIEVKAYDKVQNYVDTIGEGMERLVDKCNPKGSQVRKFKL